jgi:hypothetical protein
MNVDTNRLVPCDTVCCQCHELNLLELHYPIKLSKHASAIEEKLSLCIC